jgi:hypothetical protein
MPVKTRGMLRKEKEQGIKVQDVGQDVKKTEEPKEIDTEETQETEETEECAICFGLLNEDVYNTKCKHQFHKSCLKKMHNDKCPLCRQQMGINVEIYENEFLSYIIQQTILRHQNSLNNELIRVDAR